MLDLLKIQETGKHITKSKTKLLLTSSKLMMLTVITCSMLHILVIANGFSPVLRIFGMTLKTATLRVNNIELLTPIDTANALNDYFVSVFNRENSDIPKLPVNQLIPYFTRYYFFYYWY